MLCQAKVLMCACVWIWTESTCVLSWGTYVYITTYDEYWAEVHAHSYTCTCSAFQEVFLVWELIGSGVGSLSLFVHGIDYGCQINPDFKTLNRDYIPSNIIVCVLWTYNFLFQKAKGDIKKAGKPDPYAYIQLDRQKLNKR